MKSKRSCDVLILQWATSGRDAEVSRLLRFALQRKGYTVKEESAFDWRYHLLRHRPRLLILFDPAGDLLNLRIAKTAHEIGLKTIALVAEGDYTEDSLESSLWGWNTDHILYPEMTIQWSDRTRRMSIQRYPELERKIFVSGSSGCDRYLIYPFLEKDELKKKYSKSYERVVGYGAWCFDALFDEDPRYRSSLEFYGEQEIKRFHEDRLQVNSILRATIEKNQDTLFLLKEHPGTEHFHNTELVGLRKYTNVLLIKNEEPIGDCINACDLWMAYESTTCLEAWLLKKQTLLINPSTTEFKRTQVHKGSPHFSNFESLAKAFEHFYGQGTIPGFEEKKEMREIIKKNVVQWADGKNHLRITYLAEQLMKKTEKEPPQYGSLNHALAMGQHLLFSFSRPFLRFPYLKHFAHGKKIFNRKQMKKLDTKYYPSWEYFYKKYGDLSVQDIRPLDKLNPPI